MGFTVAYGLILIVAVAFMLTVGVASRGSNHGFSHTYYGNQNNPYCPNKIIVGGSDQWRFGFNYDLWAFQNAPFYVNDTLVFKYDAPNATVFPHSVYLLPDLLSYATCDLSKARMIGNTTQGVGEGFEFVINKWQPYFFACGEHGGLHCRAGMMKFMVLPLLRRWYH